MERGEITHDGDIRKAIFHTGLATRSHACLNRKHVCCIEKQEERDVSPVEDTTYIIIHKHDHYQSHNGGSFPCDDAGNGEKGLTIIWVEGCEDPAYRTHFS